MIGKLTPDGQITECPVPMDAFGSDGAAEIINGPDGNIWFDSTDTNAIGRIRPDGTIAIFQLATSPAGYAPRGLTVGPDDNIWMTEVLPEV